MNLYFCLNIFIFNRAGHINNLNSNYLGFVFFHFFKAFQSIFWMIHLNSLPDYQQKGRYYFENDK